MTAPNHLIGGLVFTGIFAAFTDVNILEKPEYLAITILACLIPDIDHTKSTVGKIVFPLAKLINKRFGHRTITHTLIALFVSTTVVGLLESAFKLDDNYSKLWLFGFLSHLIFDMMTVQGVPLFFPFYKNPCVLPANPDARFRTGNLRTETMIFSFFLLSGIFCQPLMESGFWLKYNQSFGMLSHLNSQFKRTSNLLNATYSYRIGSETKTGNGFVIESTENKAILLVDNHFLKLEDQTAISVFPTKTDSLLKFKTQSFVNIPIDSFSNLMQSGHIKRCEIVANSKFEVIENNISKITNSYKSNYSSNPVFVAIAEKVEVQKTFKSNPRIETLRKQIADLKRYDEKEKETWDLHLSKIEQIEERILETKNVTERQRLYDELKELEKKREPTLKTDRISDLESDLQTLIKENAINQSEFNEDNKVQESANTTFTGTITKIIIQ
jgi:inner membrane protein